MLFKGIISNMGPIVTLLGVIFSILMCIIGWISSRALDEIKKQGKSISVLNYQMERFSKAFDKSYKAMDGIDSKLEKAEAVTAEQGLMLVSINVKMENNDNAFEKYVKVTEERYQETRIKRHELVNNVTRNEMEIRSIKRDMMRIEPEAS